MEKNIENPESMELNTEEKIEIENSEDAFAPLRALETALGKCIKVTTSRIQLCRNDPSTTEFVDIEGTTDEETLHLLEESVSDIISSHDHENTTSITARSSQDRTSTFKQSATIILNNLSSEPSVTSAKTKDSFYSIPSCRSSFDGIVSPESVENAEKAIAVLKLNGPAGLVHLSSLSAEIGRPIRVWTSDNDFRKVGRTQTGEPVDAEHHEPGSEDLQGHWTLPGNLEPRDVAGQLNDCLFNVVAAQTGNIAPELRARTIERMEKNVRSLANRIDAIAKKEKCDRISLLVGGARYNGQRPQDAKRVIDNSQQGQCHPSGLYGHPRGHASHPGASGATESAENYSRTGRKSAFLSREDQDAVGHLVLETSEAQSAMEQLNRGQTSIAVNVQRSALKPGALPDGVEFYDGAQVGKPRRIREFLIVLRHYLGEQNNPEADVFVHTFYPKLE